MTRGTQYIIFDQRLGKLRLGWIRLGYVRSNRSSGQKTSGQLNIWSKGLCGLSDTLANGTSDQRNPLVKKKPLVNWALVGWVAVLLGNKANSAANQVEIEVEAELGNTSYI